MPQEVLPIPQVSSAWRGVTLPADWAPELTTGLLKGSLAQPCSALLSLAQPFLNQEKYFTHE